MIRKSLAWTLLALASASASICRADGFDDARALWKTGKYAEARKTLDELTAAGGKVDDNAFIYFDAGDGAIAVDEVYAKTGPYAAELATVDQTLKSASADRKAALASLKAIVAKMTPEELGRTYLADRTKEVECDIAFAAGEWVPMQWNESFKHWEQVQGRWHVEANGSIVGQNVDDVRQKGDEDPRPPPKSLLWRGRDLGASYEFSATIELLPYRDDKPERCAGVLLVDASRAKLVWMLTEVHRQSIFWGDGQSSISAPVKNGSEFRVRVDDHSVLLWVDGQEVGDTIPLSDSLAGPFRIGIGGPEGSPVRFGNLRVRKAPPLPPRAPKSHAQSTTSLLSRATPTVLIGVGGGMVLLLAGAVALVQKRRKKRRTATAPVAADAPAVQQHS
jgi:hypothetical protein